MYAEHDDVVVIGFLAGGLVYAGANSAKPHGLPSGYRLRPGDTFMLSLGCAVGGRFVEGERTFILGEPTADQRRYYEAVRAAQQLGVDALRPGLTCAEANARVPGRDPGRRARPVPAAPAGSRHRARHARAAVARGRRRHRARAGHDRVQRARHLRAGPRRLPHLRLHAGHRRRRAAADLVSPGRSTTSSSPPELPPARNHRVRHDQRQPAQRRGARPGGRAGADRPPRRARARLAGRSRAPPSARSPTPTGSSSSTPAAPARARATGRSPTSSGPPTSTALREWIGAERFVMAGGSYGGFIAHGVRHPPTRTGCARWCCGTPRPTTRTRSWPARTRWPRPGRDRPGASSTGSTTDRVRDDDDLRGLLARDPPALRPRLRPGGGRAQGRGHAVPVRDAQLRLRRTTCRHYDIKAELAVDHLPDAGHRRAATTGSPRWRAARRSPR